MTRRDFALYVSANIVAGSALAFSLVRKAIPEPFDPFSIRPKDVAVFQWEDGETLRVIMDGIEMQEDELTIIFHDGLPRKERPRGDEWVMRDTDRFDIWREGLDFPGHDPYPTEWAAELLGFERKGERLWTNPDHIKAETWADDYERRDLRRRAEIGRVWWWYGKGDESDIDPEALAAHYEKGTTAWAKEHAAKIRAGVAQ